ncbi:MAG: hypothetical protein ACRDC6_16550 [Shewanella sp.]
MIKQLKWSESISPNERIRYDHCIAETPFGRFVVTWKGWKKYDSPTVDETPWDSFGGYPFISVDAAKEWCQSEFNLRVNNFISID